MSRYWISCSIAVTTLLAGTAAFGANAANGLQIAQRWCAACHLVAPGQRTASDQVPTFAQIARIPNFDASKIALFLLDPHPKMPDMSLTRDEAADLAAYIAALKD